MEGPCEGALRPPLSGCYDSQPFSLVDTCYQVRRGSDGIPTLGCKWSAAPKSGSASIDRNSSPSILQCQDGKWEFTVEGRGLGPSSCRALGQSVWRVTAQDTASRGWWLYDLGFYTDSRCHTPVSGVSGTFAFGPRLPTREGPEAVFDGDSETVWRAPCSVDDTLDLCGCQIHAEGWSQELQACVPGKMTDEATQKQCAESQGRADSGCIAGRMTLGVQLDGPQEVRCVRLMQSKALSLAVESIALEVWERNGWRAVRTWIDLLGGSWHTLSVRKGCPAYVLPGTAPRWAEVVDESIAAEHGDSRTIRCIVGSPAVQVWCSDGDWSELPRMICPALELPGMKERPVEVGEQQQSPLFLLGVGFSLAFLCIAALIGGLHALGRLMKRRAWKRLAREGAALPPLSPDANRQRVWGQVDLANRRMQRTIIGASGSMPSSGRRPDR